MAVELFPLAVASGLSSLFGSALQQSYNVENMERQVQASKELMDYQYGKYGSPAAQARSLASVGLNPASLGNGHSVSAQPSAVMPSSSPIPVNDVLDLSSLGQYLQSVASAKKAGVDTSLIEEEIKKKQVERASNEFDLDLKKLFGKEFKSVELSQAYLNLLLLSDSHDLNEIEKAIGEYKQQTEKALASAKQSEAEMLKQRLDNNPVLIRLENTLLEEKAKTEKASQAFHYSQVEVNRELRRLNSALADVEENTKVDKINSLIKEYQSKGVLSDADAKESEIRLSRLLSIEDKRSSAFFAEVDNLLEWLRNKVRIFH